jgi:CRP-like cAMP-binding protein
VAAKDVPANSGLRIAQPGLENTIILEVEEHPEEVIFDRLDLIASIDLFNEMPLKKARDLLRCSYEEHYLPGQYVIKEGTLGEKFYIIAQGIVRIFNKEFEKYGFISDYFGEAALTTNSKRNAK